MPKSARGRDKPPITLVYKKSTLDLYVKEKKNARYRALMRAQDPVVSQFQSAHDAHQRSFEQVMEHLEKRGLKYRAVYRAHFRSETDFVITIGGDGTLLDASKKVRDGVLLGVNSDPEHSFGYLCATGADGFGRLFDRVLAGKKDASRVTRIGGELDGQPLKNPVLNEILVAARNPADTSRYHLFQKGRREVHKSSGLWIAAPAGSTGALRSAGGAILPLDSERISLLVREPYLQKGDKITLHADYSKRQTVRVVSQMREGRIFIDGPYQRLPFVAGSELKLHGRAPPLKLVVTRELNARRKHRVIAKR